MATQKQIDANRRNARKSTGPRSASGKKRASYNAYRHGLSRPMLGAEHRRAVEALAARILADHGKANDLHALASAREIAEADFELARIRCSKVALIERVHALGPLEPRKLFGTKRDEAAWAAHYFLGATLGNIRPKCAVDTLPPMPEEEPSRTAEAVRVLPDLARLARYEAHAIKRRDRAICALVLRSIASNNTQ
jgi:hypothetical protein